MLSDQQLRRINRSLQAGLDAKDAGDWQLAKKRFDDCISLDDGDRPSTKEAEAAYQPLFFAYIFRAQIAEEEHAFEQAICLANEALADPTFKYHALRIIGQCHRKCNRLEQAEAAFREGLAGTSNPEEQVWSYVFLFTVLIQDDARRDEAKGLLEKALELDPNYAEAHYNLGVALMDEDDLDSAQERLELAIALNPDYAYAHMKLGELHLRRVYLASSPEAEHDEARVSEHHLTKSIELQRECLTSRFYLINLHWSQQRYRKAEAECRKTVDLFPESSAAHWMYGDFLACTDRGKEKAETLLRRAIELDCEDSVAYYTLGKALLKWERWHEARAVLEQAHRLGDDRALPLLKLRSLE